MPLLYCRIYFGGLWTMILYNMVAGILRAYGNTKSPLFILIVCCIVNVAGDLLLVGGLHLGVAGAAVTTIAAQLVSAILAMKALGKTHEDCNESVWRVHFYHSASFLSGGMYYLDLYRILDRYWSSI